MTIEERNQIIQECWGQINSCIKPGRLPGNGCDETAERNGIILATNILMEMMHPEAK